jgi:hypothetical protein
MGMLMKYVKASINHPNVAKKRMIKNTGHKKDVSGKGEKCRF